MRKAILILSLTMLMAVSVPSMAATQPVVALAVNFVPPAAVAEPNDTVQLRNLDALAHTLTLNDTAPNGGKFCRDSVGNAIQCTTGTVGPVGGTGSFTLVSAPKGTYRFFCAFHPANMVGVLVVR